jgi:hypothetical protein
MAIEPTPEPLRRRHAQRRIFGSSNLCALENEAERSKAAQRPSKLVQVGPNMMFSSVTYRDLIT